jgi:uncharacterized membrane protein YeiH
LGLRALLPAETALNETPNKIALNSARILYVLDLIGVAVFAVSGALAAGRAGMDWIGVIVLATLTAIGGGTIRDVLLNRHPIFWIKDAIYPTLIFVVALGTVFYVKWLPVPAHTLLIADALGLALFAITGAQLAEKANLAPVIVVLMGTMTGVGGGAVRDVLSGTIPLILRKDIYATAAIAGIILYLIAQKCGVPRNWAMGLGIVTVAALRLVSVLYGWQLPTFNL